MNCIRQGRVDQDTGEIFEFPRKDKEGTNRERNRNNKLHEAKLSPDISSVMPRDKFEGYWLRTDREFYARMLQLDLPRQERRVLDALMMKARFGTFVDVSYAELEGMTGMQSSNISTAVSKLIEKDLIVRLSRGHYLINPMYCYMGEGDGRANMIGRYYEAKQKARKRGS